MTLLIGTVARSANAAKSHVVITADGRCTLFDGATRTARSDAYQKIFPVPGSSVAIAHHGENIIAGKPVKEFLEEFIHRRLSSVDIGQIAASLKEYADEQTIATLKRIALSKLVGFWVGGFGSGRSQPELHEICWKKNPLTGEIECENKKHGNLVFGGDAQCFVSQYCKQPVDGMYAWDRIPGQSVNYATKLHGKLYKLAESAQVEKQQVLFGGHKHQLILTRDGWHWSIPPQDQQESVTNRSQ